MNEVRTHKRGYTLVELLVVLAIIAIIASISIPILARTTFLENSALQNGSRELYAYLRAAKIYAVDHRVDTAVVYGLRSFEDTIRGERVIVADGMFLARAPTAKELRLLPTIGIPTVNLFIRVGDVEGQYHELPSGTCILDMMDPVSREWHHSLQPVRVIESDLSTEIDPSATTQRPVWNVNEWSFPAHIFTPSGVVDLPQQATARFELMVAPTPDADPESRLSDNNGDGVVESDEYRYIGVEIKPSLGRVKIAS